MTEAHGDMDYNERLDSLQMTFQLVVMLSNLTATKNCLQKNSKTKPIY